MNEPTNNIEKNVQEVTLRGFMYSESGKHQWVTRLRIGVLLLLFCCSFVFVIMLVLSSVFLFYRI